MPRNIKPVQLDGNIARVPLSQGFFAIIDAENAEMIGKWNWSALVAKRANGEIRTVYAIRKPYNGSFIYMHRLLANVDARNCIDHVDGNGLNNTMANIRVATCSQNNRNSRLRADNGSGFRGVGWSAQKNKWRARLQSYGKEFHLGFFDTPEKAYEAYKAGCAKHHGEFAPKSLHYE